MSAGFKYNLNPSQVQEELCDVQTLHHIRGPFKLDTTGLTIGTKLPRFTPVCADVKARTCTVSKNVKVLEDAAVGVTSLKIAKNSLAYTGMFLGNGSKGVTVSEIDKTNAAYDLLTVSATEVKLTAGTVLFEATAAGGTTIKNPANFVIYEETKVEEGIVLVALIARAYEIQEEKLTLPISAKDKESLTCRFMFV